MYKLCHFCGSTNIFELYEQHNIPVFQNKIYDTPEVACNCTIGTINLMQCECGFVFNSSFKSNLLNYDKFYQNEQAYSAFFLEHLKSVRNFILDKSDDASDICEIGCGKGTFLEFLREKRKNSIGCDPTYEGTASYIKKVYFSKNTFKKTFNILILRHVLEHIDFPVKFLNSICEANENKGHIYIEVPCFDWIKKHKAFWDICYEHVNYFTKKSLLNIFPNAEICHCFGGQYIYLFADINSFLVNFDEINKNTTHKKLYLNTRPLRCKVEDLYIWGAGAKGNIFCNVFDKKKSNIKAVIDSNPAKQQKFIGGTGHPIISPENFIKNCMEDEVTVVVMNENYFNEISLFLKGKKVNIHKIESFFK